MSKADNKELLSETGALASGNVRHRFAVPEADKQVNDWIECQSNLGFSLRVLIKAYIAVLGMTDATCTMNIVVPKKGRPPKTEAEKLLKAFQKPTEADADYAMESESSLEMFNQSEPVIKGPEVAKEPQTAMPTQVPFTGKTNSAPMDPMLQMMGGAGSASAKTADTDEDGFIDESKIFS